MAPDFLAMAQDLYDQLVTWRRDIHMYPELGFQEHRTASLVARTLNDLGIAVETGIGKTGVVGHLGRGRPAVGLRADMDALEIQEANDVPYASRVPGLMHACGHDAHTAMLLGAAAVLAQLRGRTRGEIRFLFQPSEERWDEKGLGGARRMMEDGAVEGLDAVVALHVDSTQTSGSIAVRSGYVWAGVDPYEATILGTSSHSAAPHQGVNPVVLLARVINAIQAIPALHTDPLHPGIISCEAVCARSSTGVIPERASLRGNIRYYEPQTERDMRQALEKTLDAVRVWGGHYELTVRRAYPPTFNDPELTALVRECAIEVVGRSRVQRAQRSMAGEDFGYLSSRVPGTYVKLGVQLEGKVRPYHSPCFDLDESSLPVGSAVLAASALRMLQTRAPQGSAP